MLKFFFWLLLLANAALFAYQRGYLEPLVSSGREPARLGRQLNADKINVIPEPKPDPLPAAAAVAASGAASAPAPGASAATVVSPAVAAGAASTSTTSAVHAPNPATGPTVAAAGGKATATAACTEIGNFNADDAKRFSTQLAALSLGDRVSRHDVPGAISHIVYIPPQGDKDGAEKKAGELRRRGVNDFYIIQDNSSLRWGISLGVFKLEETARAYLAALNQKGVHSARIGQRTGTTGLVAFQLRGLDANAKSALEKIKVGFPKQELRGCGGA